MGEAEPAGATATPAVGFAGRFVTLFALFGVLAASLLAADSWSALVNEERQLEARLTAEARNRALALGIALRELPRRADPVANSDVVRVVASDLADQARTADDPWLRSQVPFARAALADLVATQGLRGAALLNPHGGALLAAGSPPPAPASERWRDGPAIGPVRLHGTAGEPAGRASGLLLDVYLPLSPPRSSVRAGQGEPGAILAFSVPAEPVLDPVLTPAGGQPGAVWLAQTAAEGRQRLQLYPELALLPPPVERAREPFWPLLADEPGPLLARAPVDGTSFRVIAGMPAEALSAAVLERLKVNGPLAFALTLALALVLARRPARPASSGLVRAPEQEHAWGQPATGPKAVAGALTSTGALLDALPGPSGLLDREGRISATNDHFRTAIRADDVIGQPLDALGDDAFLVAWRDLLGTARDRGQVSTVRSMDDGSQCLFTRSNCEVGTLLTCQTLPEAAAGREGRQEAHSATVAALVRAVELRDPFLLGHTERLRRLAGEVGRRLHLDPPALETLDIAAALSQIGKTFVPDVVLTKHARHDQDEERAMRAHIEHAARILAPLDFGLPVVEVLVQMHERLDGSGYPQGLAGEKIDRLARILGIVDVFSARTAARSYRDAVQPGQALYYLARHPERYDGQVVAALAAVVAGQDQPRTDDDPAGTQGTEPRAA